MILTRAQRRRIDRIARGRSDEPLCVLEGPRAIGDALDGGAVAELWVCRTLAGEVREDLLERARRAGVAVGEGEARDFDRLGRTVTPRGVLALVRDTARPLDEVLAAPGLLLWLDGVQDPGNVGALVRVAAAFGAAGVAVDEGTADPLGLKALRASAGLALAVPFARSSAGEIAAACRRAGREVWLLDRGGEDLRAVPRPPAAPVLAVGGEGRGAGETARRVAARRVGIPMAPGVDSLNAAVAGGIAVWHLLGRAT